MDEQTRADALMFWQQQVMDPQNPCYGDIVGGALATLERYQLESDVEALGAFGGLGLAFLEETTRRIYNATYI